MFPNRKLKLIVLVIVVLGIGSALWVYFDWKSAEVVETPEEVSEPERKVIGKSVEGRDIEVYRFGGGDEQLLFVGGVHGGYEWNSVMLAYETLDFLTENSNVVPANLEVAIIPSLNPDGMYVVTGKEGRFSLADVPTERDATIPGRFNANDVDLNRNFDCKWAPESTWRGNVVNAGEAPFSEPEARTLKDYVLENTPVAVVFWHSQSNAVYASECEEGILFDTTRVMNAYSQASGYPPVDSFDAYSITGDAEGWLASIGIPAVTVELSTHDVIEWDRNKAGMLALFDLYSQE